MTNFYSISRKRGQFYQKSNEPKEGYEEVTYGEGKKTYHKYFKSISGTPIYFGTKEVDYQGTKLNFMELTLEDGEDTNVISVNLFNNSGYTDEAKALVSALNGLELGEPVTVNPTTSKYTGKNGKQYTNLNIYINYNNRKGSNGKNESTGYINFEDIPGPVQKTVAGRTTWDWTPQTEFYYERITEIQERFKGSTNDNNTNTGVADDDDLPF